MKKLKEVKQILKEWRKFERGEKLNEAASTTRVKYAPTQEAIKLKEELEAIYGKGSVVCYDFFDGHSDDEMLNPADGHQIELEALTKYAKENNWSRLPLSVGDIVMSDDDLILWDDNGIRDNFTITDMGEFDLTWSNEGPVNYYHGEFSINDRNQKIIYKNDGYLNSYYLWSDSKIDSDTEAVAQTVAKKGGGFEALMRKQ